MGQATRTTKLPLDLGDRKAKGANTAKRTYLQTTQTILDAARAFYVAFFLAHQAKLSERVLSFSEQHQDMRERLLSANELLTWAGLNQGGANNSVEDCRQFGQLLTPQ
jgi:hypothetical protein